MAINGRAPNGLSQEELDLMAALERLGFRRRPVAHMHTSFAAQFLVLALDPELINERVFTVGHGLDGTDAGAGGTYTLAVDESELDHSLLGALNSTNYTHLTSANHADLTDGGATTLHKHDHGGQDGLADYDHKAYVRHGKAYFLAGW